MAAEFRARSGMCHKIVRIGGYIMLKVLERSFISVVLLLSCIPSSGRAVDKKIGAEAAEKYLGASVSCVWSMAAPPSSKASASDNVPAFNVFQSKDRWVIIAGEDCAVPVLAYGEGRFPTEDEMPDNMREYLECLGKEIIWAREAGLSADDDTRWQWSHIGQRPQSTKSSDSPSVVGPLTEGILWHQNSPYNGKTPLFNGSHSPTGCVATAVAIAMYYNKWPQYGKGTIPGYTTSSAKIAMPAINIEGYKYDWDIMPANLTSKSSDIEKDAVSTLMLHIGCMLKMDYEAGASATYASNIIAPLLKYMSYKKSCTLLYASDFSHEEWFYMIKRELDEGRVIIYNASSSSAGHSMVCDGYDEATRMVSANWGWGYTQRGWYVLNTMNGIHKGWPVDHCAVFGLEPDYDGEDDSKFGRIFFNLNSATGGYGLQLSRDCTGVLKEGKFKAVLDRIDNKDNAESTNLRMVLVGRDAADKETISEERTISFKNGSTGSVNSNISTSIDCEIKGDYVIGDRIRCYYYTPGNARWYPAGRWTRNVMHEFGAYNLDFIYFPSVMRAGQVYYPEFVCGGQLAYKSVVWYYDGEEMEERFPSVVLESGAHTVKAIVTYVDESVRTIVATCNVE